MRRVASLILGLVSVGSSSAVFPGRALGDGLRAEPAAIDFGERGHNERPEITLLVENTSGSVLSGVALRPSCSCIEITPARFPGDLAPGARREVRVSMGSGRAMGDLHKYIEIQSSEGASVRVPCGMRVFQGFDQEPLEVVFAGVHGGEPQTRTVDIVWKARTPPPPDLDLEVHEVLGWDASTGGRAVNPHFRWRVEEIAKGRRIHLTLLPSHPEGRLSLVVKCSFRGKALELHARGDVFDGIALSDTSLNYNRVEWWQPNVSLYREIELSSTDAVAFEIESVRVDVRSTQTPGLTLDVTTKPASDGKRWILRSRLSIPRVSVPDGSFSGKVFVRTTHPRKPEIELGFFGFLPTPK